MLDNLSSISGSGTGEKSIQGLGLKLFSNLREQRWNTVLEVGEKHLRIYPPGNCQRFIYLFLFCNNMSTLTSQTFFDS